MKKKLIFLFGIVIFSIFFVSDREAGALSCVYRYQDPNPPNNACVDSGGVLSCGLPLYLACPSCGPGEIEVCEYDSDFWCGSENCGATYSCGCAPLPPTCSINSFTADSSSIIYNTSTTLRFSLSNSFPWSISLLQGSVLPSPFSGTGSSGVSGTGNLITTHTYRLNCNGGQAIRDLTVTVPLPVPAIGARWSENNAETITKTLTPGQTSITVPLYYFNSGESGSILNVTGCTSDNPSRVSGIDCPTIQLTVP